MPARTRLSLPSADGEGFGRVSAKVSFKKLGAEVTAYQKALSDLKEAQAVYADTYTALIAAQKSPCIEAQRSGTEQEKESARQALETARG